MDVIHDTVERFGGAVLGRISDGNSSRSCCTCGGSAVAVAAVSGFQGLMKEVVFAFVNVRPEAACRTCCIEGIIEKPNFVKKSMPRRGVVTAASKKSNYKF